MTNNPKRGPRHGRWSKKEPCLWICACRNLRWNVDRADKCEFCYLLRPPKKPKKPKRARVERTADTQRLDFLGKLAKAGTPGGFFMVNPTDGAVHRMDAGDDPDRYHDICSYGPSIRQAIDAAMKKGGPRK